MSTRMRNTALALAVGVAVTGLGPAAADDAITQDGYITGSLVIDWNSRLPENQDANGPKEGVADVYNMDATVGFTFYKGTIKCLPYVFSRHLGRVLQEGSCTYDLDVGVINPSDTSQKRVVGKLAGQRAVDRDGRSDLSAGNLRVEVQTIGRATGFRSNYAGTMVGSPIKAKTTLTELVAEAAKQSATITRMVGGNQVSLTLGDVDPVTFKAVTVPQGPSANYPEAVVNGKFIYSYETDNWFPSLTAAYGGQTDTISGGMKWVDDSETSGHYELNILFNENKATSGEAAAFSDAQGEDAFFQSDPGKSTVNGTISFQDTYVGEVETPVKSEVKYNVGLQMVTPQQTQVLWKTLLLIPNQLYGE
jgi:hypothetical protein